jgi:surface polysaccharide O-acyltransferase-like enzyme
MADGFLGNVFDHFLIFTKVAVPLFFMMSGALFYRDYNLRLTIQKWKSRFFSLCIPYLVWNTIWLVLALLGYYTPLGIFLGGVKASLSCETVLKGILLYEFFEPFWFIFQLILLTAVCPLIYLLLKNKWIGLIVMVSLFVASCFDFKPAGTLFPNADTVLFYMIGAWVGIHHFLFFTTRRSKKVALVGLAVYVLCFIFYVVVDLCPEWCKTDPSLLTVTIISCGAFWIAFDYFDMKKCPRYMSFSFLIYALHSLVGAALSKVVYMVMPTIPGRLILTAVIVFPATITIICVTGLLLEKHFPLLKKILTGK